jgi:hypothetical protein
MPKPVFTDNWKINGCPVNGPALASNGNNVALAWFTAANGEAQVKLAFSKNAGAHFGKPIRIDGGKPLGRVDVLFLDKTTALVSWLEDKEGNAEIRFVTVTSKGVKKMEKTIAKTASNRKSGVPRIAKIGNMVMLAWTEVDEGKTVIKTKSVSIF